MNIAQYVSAIQTASGSLKGGDHDKWTGWRVFVRDNPDCDDYITEYVIQIFVHGNMFRIVDAQFEYMATGCVGDKLVELLQDEKCMYWHDRSYYNELQLGVRKALVLCGAIDEDTLDERFPPTVEEYKQLLTMVAE